MSQPRPRREEHGDHPGGEVALYLDVAIDDGTTYTNRAKRSLD